MLQRVSQTMLRPLQGIIWPTVCAILLSFGIYSVCACVRFSSRFAFGHLEPVLDQQPGVLLVPFIAFDFGPRLIGVAPVGNLSS